MYKRQRKTLALMLANNSGVSRKSELLSRTSLYEDFTYSDTLDSRITATRASTKTYFDSTGTMQTAAINEFPREYDPSTLKCLGRSFWEARTNLLTYSQEFDNAAWTKGNVTITANAVTAPDGTTTADLQTATATGISYTYKAVSISINTTYTASAFFKAGTAAFFTLGFSDHIDSGATCNVNSSTLAITTAPFGGWTVLERGVTSVGGGWYRVFITALSNSSDTSTAFYACHNSTASNSSVAGQTGYVWGAQLEAGATPTPYIPTTSATVTRSADVVSMTGTNFSSWYNQTEGTFLATANTVGVASGGFQRLFDVNEGVGSERITNQLYSTIINRITVVDGGVNQAAFDNGTVSANTFGTSVITYKANDFAGAFNGGTVTTDTSGTLPSVDRIQIGHSLGSSQLNGFISRIAYWPSRLPNTDLQILSRST